MMKSFFFILSFFILTIGKSQFCDTSINQKIRVNINPDIGINEISWEILKEDGSVVASGDYRGKTLCLPKNTCYTFNLYDSQGDGMEGWNGVNGNYNLLINGNKVDEIEGNYGFLHQYSWGCNETQVCQYAKTISLGDFTTSYENGWYFFVPDSSGQYQISACGNNCQTGIWIYDPCPGKISDLNNGTLAFSNSGCNEGNGAKLVTNLIKDRNYLIRIGDINNNCTSTNINFSLIFLGPVIGCMDESACNYNPFATQSDGNCIYPGDPRCASGPDLILDSARIRSTMVLRTINNQDNCIVQEKCVSGFGNRYVIRFSTRILNRGDKDYHVGRTPNDPLNSTNQFKWDQCHQHWHYYGYAEYLLFDSRGNKVPVGFKNGFCVLDLYCQGGGTPKFTCQNMGISKDCEDEYDRELDCQWIDITDIDTGSYVFVVRVNHDKSPDALGSVETNYDNNDASFCIKIGRSAQNKPTFALRNDCPVFTDCAGTPYGNSFRDCEGVCAGNAKYGDYNKDKTINQGDVNAYFEAALNQETATPCNDLNLDGFIDVGDAALAQDCFIKGTNYIPPSGGYENHCEFPNLVSKWIDTVNFELNDPEIGFIDINLKNEKTDILGWQLKISGIEIDSVVSLINNPLYNTHLKFNNENGIIEALSFGEQTIAKSSNYSPLVRVYYTNTQGNSVCIDKVFSVVNEKYERVTALKGDCKVISGIQYQNNPYGAKVFPNPFNQNATLSFINLKNEKLKLDIVDIQGKIVKDLGFINGNNYYLENLNLPNGLYFYRLIGLKIQVGKLLIE